MVTGLDDKKRRRNRLIHGTIFGILLVALAISSWHTYRWYMYGDEIPVDIPIFVLADPSVDETEVPVQQVEQHNVPANNPRYVSIPSLNVSSTRVFSMGVDANNILEAPANISDAAWYNQSGTPGSGGVILINAHNGGVTRNGVFSQLHSLAEGDIIKVERGDGQIFSYEVRENRNMHLDDVNPEGMRTMMQSAEEGKEALNLMTCEGKWVPRLGQFDRRIMVRAVLID